MEISRMSRKRYFLALAVVIIAVAFAAICALGVAIARDGSNVAIMVAMGVAIALPMWMAMFPRKPSQRANYPRFEHLRIAGKYAPTAASKVGVSPLYLK